MKSQLFMNNAMLYKDITQWLRNRTFVYLFWGLIVFCEFAAWFVYAKEIQGTYLFHPLGVALMLYMLAIAYSSFDLTVKEMFSDTFELYELSGISLEKMTLGKLMSMVAQFMFGLFAIMPFMFFSYMLGGVDLSSVVLSLGIILLFMLPLYLSTLLLSFWTRWKKMVPLIRTLFAVSALVMLNLSFGLSAFASLGLRKVTWDTEAFVLIGSLLLLYGQLCLLLFCACCHAISRKMDTRETSIKLLSFTLVCSAYAMTLFSKTYVHGFLLTVKIVLCLFVLIIAMIFYYHRLDVPAMARLRMGRAGVFGRMLYFFFRPGADGSFRLLCWLFLLVMAGMFLTDQGGSSLALWILQFPFFIAFPGMFIFFLRKQRSNHERQRGFVFAFWGLSFALFMTLTDGLGSSAEGSMAELLGVSISPFFSLAKMIDNPGDENITLHLALGVLGLVLMFLGIQKRERDLRKSAA